MEALTIFEISRLREIYISKQIKAGIKQVRYTPPQGWEKYRGGLEMATHYRVLQFLKWYRDLIRSDKPLTDKTYKSILNKMEQWSIQN